VVGILTKNGQIDVDRMRIIKQVTRDMKLTFHRAFDVCSQSVTEAIDSILSIPCDRILTSGKQATAYHGKACLKEVVAYAENRIEIIAGGGIDLATAAEIIRYSHVTGIHTASAVMTKVYDTYPAVEAEDNSVRSISPSQMMDAMMDSGSGVSSVVCEPNTDSRLEMSWVDVKSTPSALNRSITQELGRWDVVCSSKVGAFLKLIHTTWEDIHNKSHHHHTGGFHRSQETIFQTKEMVHEHPIQAAREGSS
jgi:hypothetical protein